MLAFTNQTPGVFHVFIIIEENQFVPSFFAGNLFIENLFGPFAACSKPLIVQIIRFIFHCIAFFDGFNLCLAGFGLRCRFVRCFEQKIVFRTCPASGWEATTGQFI